MSIFNGRESTSARSPGSWQPGSPSSQISATINNTKPNNMEMRREEHTRTRAHNTQNTKHTTPTHTQIILKTTVQQLMIDSRRRLWPRAAGGAATSSHYSQQTVPAAARTGFQNSKKKKSDTILYKKYARQYSVTSHEHFLCWNLLKSWLLRRVPTYVICTSS